MDRAAKAFAQILGALDDQVELHRQMNETLDPAAQAIFEHFGGNSFRWAGAAARQEMSHKAQRRCRKHSQRRACVAAARGGNRGRHESFVTLACPSFSFVRDFLLVSFGPADIARLAVQHFEFTRELSWKFIRRWLETNIGVGTAPMASALEARND